MRDTATGVPLEDRLRGALWGTFVGDALAMPAHWYYDRTALLRDYGHVVNYMAPKNPHPESILWRSKYEAANERGEILFERREDWGQRGVHYHQHLRAGENTLNLQLVSQLMRSLIREGGYDPEDYIERYMGVLRTPGAHRDTYLEEAHRGFFTNYANGSPPLSCGIADVHVGGLVSVAPLAVFYHRDRAAAREAVRTHVALTHDAPATIAAAELVTDLLLDLFEGVPADRAIEHAARDPRGPWEPGSFNLEALLRESDVQVVCRRLGTACYLRMAVPATLFLARRYAAAFEDGLIANTNLGGDNCHRGAVLGAILGASVGASTIPAHWRDGLLEAREYAWQIDGLVARGPQSGMGRTANTPHAGATP
jgi:ADP-ribosylglycohydrolase